MVSRTERMEGDFCDKRGFEPVLLVVTEVSVQWGVRNSAKNLFLMGFLIFPNFLCTRNRKCGSCFEGLEVSRRLQKI